MDMRKILNVIAAVLSVAVLMAACGAAPEPAEVAARAEAGQGEGSEEKIELVIATMRHPQDRMGFDTEIQDAAARFNRLSERYHVTVIDYLQEGNDGKQNGLTKLSTEIIGGKYPDMVCFSQIPPFPFLAKGLLLDMDTCIAADQTITPDDIVAVKALRSLGGLYLLGSNFTADTMIAQYSRFGDRYGWTFREYLDIEAVVGPDVWVIYNITHNALLKNVAQRYTRAAIDWASGTCSFDTEDFVALLNACARVREKQATKDDELIGLDATFVSEGKLIAATSMTDQVYTFARDEAFAGGRLSYIGWPTVDGSCGTDVRFQHPVGIVSKSEHIEGCWAFVKYLLQEQPVTYGIPVYKPRLKAAVEEAKVSEEKYEQMTDDQAERFFDLLDHIENLAIYDETVTNIILTESEDFFVGHRTAEETAKVIQAKVSLYLAEQR